MLTARKRMTSVAARPVERHFRLANAVVRIEGPEPLITALDRMLPCRGGGNDLVEPIVSLRVTWSDEAWEIRCDGASTHEFGALSPGALVAEKTVGIAAAEAAKRTGVTLLRAAILQRSGFSLALVGDDVDSWLTLAFHLHAREWTTVSFSHSFVDRDRLTVVSLGKLATIASSRIADVPRRCRAAIEASPWYDSGDDLLFYAVDPSKGSGAPATAVHLISALVIVDGEIASAAAIEEAPCDEARRFLGDHPRRGDLRCARLKLGHPIASCDAVESWADELLGT
jgi:hypothetical protein